MNEEMNKIITEIKNIPEGKKCIVLSVYEHKKTEDSTTLKEDIYIDASLEDAVDMVAKALRDLAMDNECSEEDMEEMAENFKIAFLGHDEKKRVMLNKV